MFIWLQLGHVKSCRIGRPHPGQVHSIPGDLLACLESGFVLIRFTSMLWLQSGQETLSLMSRHTFLSS